MILDGKVLAKKLYLTLKDKLSTIYSEHPTLVIITAGEDEASKVYIRKKKEACEDLGINCIIKEYNINNPEWYIHLKNDLDEYNNNPVIDGIIIQKPIPNSHLFQVDPKKDVDGTSTYNMGLLATKPGEAIIPPTVQGILYMLNEYKINTVDSNIVILGRSDIVGRPLSLLLSQHPYDANVTVLHSKSTISALCKLINNSDIVISATGNQDVIDFPLYIPTLIDVGIHRIENGLQGDIKKEFTEFVTNITPVPGGVGPLTVACLMYNVVNNFLMRKMYE